MTAPADWLTDWPYLSTANYTKPGVLPKEYKVIITKATHVTSLPPIRVSGIGTY